MASVRRDAAEGVRSETSVRFAVDVSVGVERAFAVFTERFKAAAEGSTEGG